MSKLVVYSAPVDVTVDGAFVPASLTVLRASTGWRGVVYIRTTKYVSGESAPDTFSTHDSFLARVQKVFGTSTDAGISFLPEHFQVCDDEYVIRLDEQDEAEVSQ